MSKNYELVTFEIAERLNKLGYLQHIGYYYNVYNKTIFATSYYTHSEAIFAPNVKEAADWIMTMFKVPVEPNNNSIAEFLKTIKS